MLLVIGVLRGVGYNIISRLLTLLDPKTHLGNKDDVTFFCYGDLADGDQFFSDDCRVFVNLWRQERWPIEPRSFEIRS